MRTVVFDLWSTSFAHRNVQRFQTTQTPVSDTYKALLPGDASQPKPCIPPDYMPFFICQCSYFKTAKYHTGHHYYVGGTPGAPTQLLDCSTALKLHVLQSLAIITVVGLSNA
eukprot:scaffold37381_cov16-Prasinocladus_malaysianus.AAC.1